MFGRSYSPHSSGDAYGNLGWLSGQDALVSHPVWSGEWCLGLSFADLELFLAESNKVVASFKLQEQSFASGIEWVNQIAQSKGRNNLLVQLPYQVPGFDPLHKFNSADFQLTRHFADLFHNTQQVLQHLSQIYEPTEPIRCWPHHFDLATRLILQAHKDPELETSIGFGFSPGDEAINELYFYVNCWPYPQLDSGSTPDIGAHGQWNLEGWIGTTLKYRDFADHKNQQSLVLEYFTRSIESLRVLLSG
jgi:hypothetical protein